jgi:hypothetical protein
VIEIPSVMDLSFGVAAYKIIEGIGANTSLFFDLNTDPEPFQRVNGGTYFINDCTAWTLLSQYQSCIFTSITKASVTNNHLLIYPNPANNYLTIKLSGSVRDSCQLELVNLFGKRY